MKPTQLLVPGSGTETPGACSAGVHMSLEQGFHPGEKNITPRPKNCPGFSIHRNPAFPIGRSTFSIRVEVADSPMTYQRTGHSFHAARRIPKRRNPLQRNEPASAAQGAGRGAQLSDQPAFPRGTPQKLLPPAHPLHREQFVKSLQS